jgi:hypothetical protein
MAARLYDTRRWTEEEDRLLRSMSASGKSLTLITAKLKRPIRHIKGRANDLGIGLPGTDIGKRRRR